MRKFMVLLLVVLMVMSATVACAPKAADEPAAEKATADEPEAEVAAEESMDGMKIGISVGDLRLERWQRDLGYMVAEGERLGAEVISTSGDGDDQLQVSQIENMLTQGVDILIIIPGTSSKVLAPIVEAAHVDGVKVIAYDRIIEDCDLDYYITFDMVEVGRLQTRYLLERVPTGKYYLLNGPKEDNNAQLFRQGQMEVLQQHIDSGDVEIVGDQWAPGWSSEEAMKLTENVLTANNNDVDAILASNDSTATGAVQAMIEQDLAGVIPITGQDASLAACKNIVAGNQTMSVYKSLKNLAEAAVKMAYDVVQGNDVETDSTAPNGKIDVPTKLFPVVAVDEGTMMDLVIADGFHAYEDVYADIPEDDRP